MRRFWIDTDTASDDAVAILMALRWPDVHVEGISIVAGNVPVEMGSKNARYTVELCGKDTPVYVGAPHPFCRPPSWAHFFHGPDGMGNQNYPEPKRPAEEKHGVQALIDAARRYGGELNLVTLGPLTNIATALTLAPDIAQKIKSCTIMGGAAASLGNITPAAEFNIWVDPESAKAVFFSGMSMLMVGWEHCRAEANLSDEEIATVRSFKTKYADFAIDCNYHALKANREWLQDPGLGLPDPVAMSVALDPAICTKRGTHHVNVEYGSELTRGMTVVDQLDVMHEGLKPSKNMDVVWEIDPVKWKDALYRCLRD